MYLVAIAWMYVVLMMSVAEVMHPDGTLLGAFFTFLLYGVLPLAIVLYIMGARLRSKRLDTKD
jgi:membrane protein implicated in regulation of membrane protease activity